MENKTVEEVCKELNINIEEVVDEAQRYFDAKLARPQYKAYLDNLDAQAKLYIDCYRDTLLSYISVAKARKNWRR